MLAVRSRLTISTEDRRSPVTCLYIGRALSRLVMPRGVSRFQMLDPEAHITFSIRFEHLSRQTGVRFRLRSQIRGSLRRRDVVYL